MTARSDALSGADLRMSVLTDVTGLDGTTWRGFVVRPTDPIGIGHDNLCSTVVLGSRGSDGV